MIGTRRYGRPGRAAGTWLGLLLTYLLLQVGRWTGAMSGPVEWYLADIVCLPLVLGLILLAQRLWRCTPAWTLPRWHGLVAAIGYGVYFEAVLPRFRASAVGDIRDVVCYLAGWLIFEGLINRARPARSTAGRWREPCSSRGPGC